MPVANYNYTGRRRIDVKDAGIEIIEADNGFIRVKVKLNLQKIKNEKSHKIVIDGESANNLERHDLKVCEEQEIDFGGFEKNASPQFRIKLIATNLEECGLVLASTPYTRAKAKSNKLKREGFFEPTPVNHIGDAPWQIEWLDPANPELLINSELAEIYGGDWKNPQLQALYLPTALKECLLGILSRTRLEDLEKDTFAYKLIHFCMSTLDLPLPEDPFFDGETLSTNWLSWADEAYEAFCNKKWRNNKTLLNNMLENKP